MAETITIHGLREVQRALYSYSQQAGDKVVLGALRLGANAVKKQAQDNAPVKTGKLRRGIRVSRSKIHRGRLSDDLIGVYINIRKGKNGPFYAKFQEDGWKAGKRFVPGKKFIERAFISKREEAVNIIVRAAASASGVLARKLGL